MMETGMVVVNMKRTDVQFDGVWLMRDIVTLCALKWKLAEEKATWAGYVDLILNK